MPDPVPDEIIRSLPIFARMTGDERRRLLGISTIISFSAGDRILHQGDNGQNFLVLLEGECTVVKQTSDGGGSSITLADLRPPAHFGEMSFFHKASHSATVRAITNVDLLRITRDAYNQLIDNGDLAAYKLALNAVDLMADRLRRMDQWVTNEICRRKDDRRVSEWTDFRRKLFDLG